MTKINSLLVIALIVFIASCKTNPNYNPYMPVGPGSHHQCLDATHKLCDGHCSCDGLGCDYATNATLLPGNSGKVAIQYVSARAYQLEIAQDSIILYDGNRVVKKMFFSDDSEIGSVINEDNR